jgi:hypothetical protein
MDVAYMGELVAYVDQEVWKLNMVGMSECNRTGAGDKMKAEQKKLKVGTYALCFFKTRHHQFLSSCELTTI